MRLQRTLVPTLLLALAAAAPAFGQQQPADEDTQQILAELQQIRQQLERIEVQALESDEALQQRQEEVQDLVIETMLEIDPDMEAKFERMESLQAEFQAAQEAEDMERIQALMAEAQELQQGFMEAQARAMERPNVVRAIEGFRDDLIAKMHEVEPETERLIARAEELAAKLQS
jgi:hypothetical protein